MNIYIDTSVKGCNIALFDNEKILAQVQNPIERGHAEIILPLFQKLIQGINKTPQDIENIYVSIGPGSFTGLRVGLTTAQFMGFSLQIPVHGLSTFQIFSCAVLQQNNRMILVETKRADYYCQIIDQNHEPISEAQCLSPNDVVNQIAEDMIVTGDAANRFQRDINYKGQIINQEMVNVEAVVYAIQSGDLAYHKPEAFYIRDADVSKPKATTR